MIELSNKMDKLFRMIDDEDCIKKNSCLFKKVLDNKDLVNKIKEYNLTKDNNLRLEIYKNKEIIDYKKNENDINLLIMEINREFKNRFKRSECSYENN